MPSALPRRWRRTPRCPREESFSPTLRRAFPHHRRRPLTAFSKDLPCDRILPREPVYIRTRPAGAPCFPGNRSQKENDQLALYSAPAHNGLVGCISNELGPGINSPAAISTAVFIPSVLETGQVLRRSPEKKKTDQPPDISLERQHSPSGCTGFNILTVEEESFSALFSVSLPRAFSHCLEAPVKTLARSSVMKSRSHR